MTAPEYTPTPDELREAWILHRQTFAPHYRGEPVPDYGTEFDRAIAAVKAEALQEVFDILDGKGGKFEYATTRNGKPMTIEGMRAFTADWNGDDPLADIRELTWEEMTIEQRFKRSQFSAQHWVVKELAALRTTLSPSNDTKEQ